MTEESGLDVNWDAPLPKYAAGHSTITICGASIDLNDLEDLLPQVPHSNKCDCGGSYIEVQHPKPEVRSAIICESCGRWLRWKSESPEYLELLRQIESGEVPCQLWFKA